jgi:glycosyltransferase involved in cell wall biosynthesis
MLKHLKRDHEIAYLSFVRPDDPPEALEKTSEYCHRLVTIPLREPRKFGARFYCDLTFSLASPLPYAIRKYGSGAMRSAIEVEMRERDYDVVVCDFLVSSINLPSDLGCATVLFQHNVESMIWRRHFETQKHGFKRAFLKAQWRKMVPYERETCRGFDAVIAVSEADRDRMREEFGLQSVYDVPTGVDTSYFSPAGLGCDPLELVFTGSMDWIPNQDAMLYFADKIFPIISQAVPGCKLTVVGRNPGPALLRLEQSNPRIKVTGRVDDIRTYIARAAAYIVPIRIGGGTRIKIYEAMAMGKPVISTGVGAEGLPVRDKEDLLIADEPEEFAEAVIRVLGDARLANRLGERARAVVCEKFGWERAADSFAGICERAAGRRASRQAA